MPISSAEASAQENQEKIERKNRERLTKFEQGLNQLKELDIGGDLVTPETYREHCEEELSTLMSTLSTKTRRNRGK